MRLSVSLIILWLIVSPRLSLADDDFVVIIDNSKGESDSLLVGYPGRLWAKTADRIYLSARDGDLSWLDEHNIRYQAVSLPDETNILYLCYGRGLVADESQIIDAGERHLLARIPVVGAQFYRRLVPRLLRAAQAAIAADLATIYEPEIDSLIARVTQDTLAYYLRRISGEFPIDSVGRADTIRTRYSGTPDNQLAAWYINQVLQDYGYATEYHHFYGGSLRHVAAHPSGRVWAAAETGEALRSTDGGVTWWRMPVAVSAQLWGVTNWGVDSVWITGSSGTLLFSSDGGQTFVTQIAGTSNFLFGICFVSPNLGWVVGDAGTVLRTTNGGATWTAQSVPTSNRLYDVFFVDASYGWAVGRNGTIVSTTNGGASWAMQSSGTTQRLYGVRFTSRDNGWVVGWGGVVRRTTNGGSSWQAVNLGSTIEEYHVDFADAMHGCIVGWNGEIFVTADGGTSWQPAMARPMHDFYGVTCADPANWFAVGDGMIARSTDGGWSWHSLTPGIEGTWVNVIATKPGMVRPGQQVIICGHFDDTSEQPLVRAPGADDNGSGSVAVLEAARLCREKLLERTVKFCLWNGEEQGLLGSDAYASEAFSRGDTIVGVLNFDMIAYDGNGDNVAELHCGTAAASIQLGSLFNGVVADYQIGLSPNLLTTQALGASDHASFWDRGYPAMLGIENYYGDFNPHYHSTGDNISQVRWPYFTKFVKAVVGALATLARPISGPDTAGAIAGRITDEWANAVQQAVVSLIGYPRRDTTDSQGGYLLSLVPPGTYDVAVTCANMHDTTITGVVVTSGDTTILDVILRYACEYVPGDINGDGGVAASDVTFGVRFFKGLGAVPPDSCYHASLPDQHWLYVAGDVNGNCEFRGSDITRLVSYLKGSMSLAYCPLLPP